MALQDLAFRAAAKWRRTLGLPPLLDSWSSFALDPAEFARLSAAASSGVAKTFFAHRGRLVNKWIHYLDIYDRHFAVYRNTPVRMLEIGVFKGGSLDMWRDYFGADATIFGIDVNPECAAYVTPPNQIRIGSQDDPPFLRSVADEIGPLDIVLDDGSHVGRHQRVSFDTLFPAVKEGGLYVIEDLHTSYWPVSHEGGYRRKGTAIEHVKTMIDDMHGWYHRKAIRTPAKDQIVAIHVYDSMVILEKGKINRPAHTMVG